MITWATSRGMPAVAAGLFLQSSDVLQVVYGADYLRAATALKILALADEHGRTCSVQQSALRRCRTRQPSKGDPSPKGEP